MVKRLILITVFIISGVLIYLTPTHAGFGISPPFIRTKNPIFPGSEFKQKIRLLRSSAEEELLVKISIDAPEIEDWITIDKGEQFPLPVGELAVPMMVNIKVPNSADVGNYSGHISIQIVPSKGGGGGVAIALGARVDIDLKVTNEEFIDFVVRRADVLDIETLKKPWNWPIFSWFFYRLKVSLDIENIGNTAVAPSKVELDIYDLTQKKLLEKHRDTRIKKIAPLSRGKVLATFSTKLEPGEYWGKVRIYYNEDIIHQDKIIFTVYKAGELPGGSKLGKWPWLLMGLYIFICLAIIAILIKIRIWQYIYKILYIISWPLRIVIRQIKKLTLKLNHKFWQWLHRKSAKHQANIEPESMNNNDPTDEK